MSKFDSELDRLLAACEVEISSQRVHHVRTAILVAAHEMGRRGLADLFAAFFGMRPALLLATGLLGLFLGASLPGMNSDSTAAFLDYHPQGFLTGDFG